MEEKEKESIKQIEDKIKTLTEYGCILEYFNLEEIKECLEKPKEFRLKPSDIVENVQIDINDIKEEIAELDNLLTNLQYILEEEEE